MIITTHTTTKPQRPSTTSDISASGLTVSLSLWLRKKSSSFQLESEILVPNVFHVEVNHRENRMYQLVYSPFNSLSRFHRDWSRVLDHWGDLPIQTSRWIPDVDIHEDDNNYVVAMDLPGVDAEQVDITLENDVLTISGERLSVEKDKGIFKRHERVSGRFTRKFTLPEGASNQDITAKVDNGVLEVTIPKQEKARPLSITVQS